MIGMLTWKSMMIQVSGMFFSLTKNQDQVPAAGQYEILACQICLSFSIVNRQIMLIKLIFDQW